jgi:hypothetical protein
MPKWLIVRDHGSHAEGLDANTSFATYIRRGVPRLPPSPADSHVSHSLVGLARLMPGLRRYTKSFLEIQPLFARELAEKGPLIAPIRIDKLRKFNADKILMPFQQRTEDSASNGTELIIVFCKLNNPLK